MVIGENEANLNITIYTKESIQVTRDSTRIIAIFKLGKRYAIAITFA
jgi:hypothetical protein